MSVDDWARKQAERYAHGDVYGFRAGVASLADALLSDEAVEALLDAQQLHTRSPHTGTCVCDPVLRYPFTNDGALAHEKHAALRALQAAVDAVTKEARND